MISFANVLKDLHLPSLPQGGEQLGQLLLNGKQLALTGHDSSALLNWSKAAEISSEETATFIKELFAQLRTTGSDSALLTTGLMLLKLDRPEPPLTNLLGNLARKQENLGLAKKLYAVGIKAKPLYKLSLYNMAATTAKLELYDSAIPLLIKKWLPEETLHFPPTLTDPELVKQLSAQLQQTKQAAKEARLKELVQLQELAEQKMDALKVHGYTRETEMLQQSDCIPTKLEILAEVQKEVGLDDQNPERASPLFRQKRRYDLGLVALDAEQGPLAINCFDRLIQEAAPLPYLKMLEGLAQYQAKGLDAGLEALNDCLHQDPKDRYSNANLGVMHAKAGHSYSGALFLLIAASLLECSNGHFHFPDFVAEADRAFADPEKQSLALKLYNQIVLEKDDPVVWARIAKLYFDKENLTQAAYALKELLRLEPANQYAKDKLTELSEKFLEAGAKLEEEKKYKGAMKIYLQAASIAKNPVLLKRMEEGFLRLKMPLRAQQVAKERMIMVMMDQRQKATEKQNELLKTGMAYLKHHQGQKAAQVMEKALALKANRTIYQTLCALYQEQGRPEELNDLERRWVVMVRKEEEQLRQEKDFQWYYAGV